ncbi:MAG TPA: hypothetical protein VJR24_10730 [Gemmatimonadaceae bacterium]|nr:hypothetical protein [Gemmatimonadaceae bacterium]
MSQTQCKQDRESIRLSRPEILQFRYARKYGGPAAGEIARAVARWRQTAKKKSIPSDEIDRMESAFEHEDSSKARKW